MMNVLTKSFLVFLLAAFVFTPGLSGEQNKYKGMTVDQIYQTIRAEGPRYEWDQRFVNFRNEGMNVVCTLVIPKTGTRPPVVVTLNGFGEDRHYIVIPNTGGEYFYARLSRILAEQGFATLRVDYRGSGDSDGDFTFTSFSSQISDALAAVQFITHNLRRQVNWRNIGMVGFSQGGLVASVAASMNPRIASLAIWSAVASPYQTYEGLLTKNGLQQGLALPDGGSITIDVYIDGQLYGAIDLGKNFFLDIFKVDPIAAIRNYKGPLLYVAGIQDNIVWPQPFAGELYLNYHDGEEKLVVLDGGHEFKTDIGPELFDQTLYWTAAWFIKTLD